MSANETPLGPQFSLCDCDAYLDHLTRISVQQHVVVATDNVANQFGIVVLRQGTPLGGLAAEKLRGQRLNMPVDEALELRHEFTPETLVRCFFDLLEAEPDLLHVNEHFDFAEQLRHLCLTSKLPDTALQKLAVMRLALPRVFHRTLFTTWLGALIARQRKLGADEVGLVFLAGLMHDLGLLHINPAWVDKKRDIATNEWAAIQSHVEIGARIAERLFESRPRLPEIIRQHHERCDGAGYPAGKEAGQLDTASSIIALADMLHALRFQHVLLNNRNLADCMAYLRVNRRTFDEANFQETGRILLSTRAIRGNATPAAPCALPFQALLNANRSLMTLLQAFAAKQDALATLRHEPLGASVVRLIAQVQWVASSSGLGNEAFEHWLQHSIVNNDEDSSAEDVFATAQEVFWLVRRIDRQLRELIPLARGKAGESTARELAVLVSSELKRAWNLFGNQVPAAA